MREGSGPLPCYLILTGCYFSPLPLYLKNKTPSVNKKSVILAKAGIHFGKANQSLNSLLDSRLCGNDDYT
jgi:hypothetical protein